MTSGTIVLMSIACDYRCRCGSTFTRNMASQTAEGRNPQLVDALLACLNRAFDLLLMLPPLRST